MTDLELGFAGVVVFSILLAVAVGWWLGWRSCSKWDEGVARQAFRHGRKSAVADVCKQFKIELGTVKAEKELKRELLGK